LNITPLPKITVITPSYNQAQYLETTIRSVLDQDYPNLEYIVIDGGSTDGSVEIIKRYAERIAYWVSEPDHGQSHAINKGIQKATGEWIGWQNSDDIYYPNAFKIIAQKITQCPSMDLITGDINLIDENGEIIRDMRYVKPTYQSVLAEGMVLTNQAAFWKRSLHQRLVCLNEGLHYAFDYEWFLRAFSEPIRATHVSEIIGALRCHDNTKTSQYQQKFIEEYQNILHGRVMPTWKKKIYLIRRLLLTVLNGHYRYIYRGIIRRVSSDKKK